MAPLRKYLPGRPSLIEDVKDYAIFMVGTDRRVASWNAGAQHILGFNEGEIMGEDFLLLFPTPDNKASIAAFMDPPGEGGRLELECWCAGKGDARFWAVVTLSRLVETEGGGEGWAVIIRDLTERRVAEERLRASEAQLRSLAARLQAVREEERTRLARELHDEFGQMLTALRMDISIMERLVSKTVKEPLGRISLFEKIASMSDLLEKTIRATRHIITELRPPVLDELGLSTAIQWQALEFENRTGIRCRITRMEHDLTPDPDTSTAVFRILQEALTNVARHASASRVAISLNAVGDSLVMAIEDDGKGMTEEQRLNPKSTGLLGIRERVLALSGQFDIRGRPGEGTRLSISLPYWQPNRDTENR